MAPGNKKNSKVNRDKNKDDKNSLIILVFGVTKWNPFYGGDLQVIGYFIAMNSI